MKNILLVLVLVVMQGGCGDDPPKTTERPAPDKHPETKKLEAADGVGYDGQGLKRTVDHMLDKREDKDKELDEARKAAGGEDHTKE